MWETIACVGESRNVPRFVAVDHSILIIFARRISLDFSNLYTEQLYTRRWQSYEIHFSNRSMSQIVSIVCRNVRATSDKISTRCNYFQSISLRFIEYQPMEKRIVQTYVLRFARVDNWNNSFQIWTKEVSA